MTDQAGLLTGKSAVVTGGSRGIGAAVARVFAREGAGVVLNYLHSATEAAAVVDEIVAAGGEAVAIQADVTREEDVASLAQAAHDRFGAIDILVNNAGRNNLRKAFAALSWSDFERQIAVTLQATLLATQAFLPGMIDRGWGRVVMIGSSAVHDPTPGSYAYLTAKGGLAAFARTLALEVASVGVTVNVVEPALVLTDRADAFSDEEKERYLAGVPIGHIAHPDEIAETVLFLASGQAGYITGASLNVSGGKVMGL